MKYLHTLGYETFASREKKETESGSFCGEIIFQTETELAADIAKYLMWRLDSFEKLTTNGWILIWCLILFIVEVYQYSPLVFIIIQTVEFDRDIQMLTAISPFRMT